MRPKKVILCVAEDEQLLSRRAFLLETRGYRVVKAPDAQRGGDMLRQILPGCLDLLLLHAPCPNALTLLRAAQVLHPFARTLVTSDFAGHDVNLAHADVYLPMGCWSAAEMLERIRILVARKRGPRVLRTVLNASRENEQKKPVASCVLPTTGQSVVRDKEVA